MTGDSGHDIRLVAANWKDLRCCRWPRKKLLAIARRLRHTTFVYLNSSSCGEKKEIDVSSGQCMPNHLQSPAPILDFGPNLPRTKSITGQALGS
mmetsp:Transcript_32694/g.68764  ORF Transcript_32694/g.68764 Transcript_32694/m.68764 type:complete len:94 (-) Transcript_32694:7-288(-)